MQNNLQTDTPFPMTESEWAKGESHFTTLRNLLQNNPGQVFSLDTLQTGFPVLSVPLLASLFVLISKDKVRQYLRGAIANASMNIRIKYIQSYFYFLLAKAYRGRKTRSDLNVVNPIHMFQHIMSPAFQEESMPFQPVFLQSTDQMHLLTNSINMEHTAQKLLKHTKKHPIRAGSTLYNHCYSQHKRPSITVHSLGAQIV